MPQRAAAPPALALLLALSGCLSGDPTEAQGSEGVPARIVAAEHGSFQGSLTAASASAVHSFNLMDLHAELRVILVLATNLPQNHIDANVTAPDGRSDEVDTGPLLYVLPGIQPATAFQDAPAGTWQVTVALTGGALADYEVHWCTTGSGQAVGNPACRP